RFSAMFSPRSDGLRTERSSHIRTSPAWPDIRGPRGQRGRSVRGTASPSSYHVTGSLRPTASDRTGRSGSTTSADCSRSRVSLSEDLRNELAAIAPRRECDRLAELSGLFRTAGSFHLHGRGEISLHLDLVSPAAARRAFSVLRDLGVSSEIRTYQRHAFGRETRYQLHVEGEERALRVLHEAGVVTAALAPLERPPKRVVGRACCRGAYLRGTLLGSGSLSGPRSPHLEIRSATREGAEFVASVAARAAAEMQSADDQINGQTPPRAPGEPRAALVAAGRRRSSEDDLLLPLNRAPDLGDGRGLNPPPDEHRPAANQVLRTLASLYNWPV